MNKYQFTIRVKETGEVVELEVYGMNRQRAIHGMLNDLGWSAREIEIL